MENETKNVCPYCGGEIDEQIYIAIVTLYFRQCKECGAKSDPETGFFLPAYIDE
jgi:DNA-directed RNA polymerase subunit RPC12/RpoP